jgi:WD40 repeat protein
VKVWNPRTGKQALDLQGHSAVAFAPDSQSLLSAAPQQRLTIWDLTTGKPRHQFPGYRTQPIRVAWSKQGGSFASTDGTKAITIWSIPGTNFPVLAAGTLGLLGAPQGPLSASMTLGASSAAGPVRVAQLPGHQRLIHSLAFSPDGTRLASAGGDQAVIIWDLQTRSPARIFQGHSGGVVSIAFDPTGKDVASAGWDGAVRLWFAATGQEFLTLPGHAGLVHGIAFSADGERLLSCGQDGTLRLWHNANLPEYTPLQGHTRTVQNLAFHPGGKQLVSVSEDRTVRLWDLNRGQGRILASSFLPYTRVVVLPNGKQMACATVHRTLSILDSATGEEQHTLTGPKGPVLALACSPVDSLLASGHFNGEVWLWDPATGKRVGKLTRAKNATPVMGLAFSPDGKRVAVGWVDGLVQVFQTQTGAVERTLDRSRVGYVRSITFSPDGRFLATGGADKKLHGQAKLWDARTGQLLRTLVGHPSGITAVAWMHNSRRLATAGADGTVKVWDTGTGDDLVTLRAHLGSAVSVAFSADGTRLASAGEDGLIKVWQGTAQKK